MRAINWLKENLKAVIPERALRLSIHRTRRYIYRSIISVSFISAVFCLLIFSFYRVIRWKVESDLAAEEINEVLEIATNPEESGDETNEEISEETKEYVPSQYWKYLNTNLSSINFSELKSFNSNTIGWVKVNNTNINYPIVQSSDNDFYLHHSFDRSYNDSGWVFMDYRNKPDFSNRNNILYAHGRLEGTMFGTLKNALNYNWQTNEENHIITTATGNKTFYWQIFSVYRTPNTNDYIRTIFNAEENFNNFLTMLKDRSVYNFGVNINGKDKILTLSTCIGADDRMVVHAKLLN